MGCSCKQNSKCEKKKGKKKNLKKRGTRNPADQVLVSAGVADVVLIDFRGYIDESMVAVAKEVLAGHSSVCGVGRGREGRMMTNREVMARISQSVLFRVCLPFPC
jgi:hypothetical protein